MGTRSRLGPAGEDLAARWLADAGYRIVQRNFRCELGEIDLIALAGTTVVFVEVKTRRTDFYGEPSEAVTPLKQARLRRLAARWLDVNDVRAGAVRFDVISIVLNERETRVTHLQDAF